MKTLAIILLFFVACAPDRRVQYLPQITVTYPMGEGPVKFDTTSVIIVCIDTAKSSPDWRGDKTFWIWGYEVSSWDLAGKIRVATLDGDKKPLKYIGWIWP